MRVDGAQAAVGFDAEQVRRESQAKKDEERRVGWLPLLLLLAILAMLWVLYGAITEDKNMVRGDQALARGKLRRALDFYLRSESEAGYFALPERTYKIATIYHRMKDYERAVDFYIRVLKESGSGEYYELARNGQMKALAALNTGDLQTGGKGPVAAAQAAWHRNYNLLLNALQANRSGVSAELVEAYENYKKSHEAYKKAIGEALKRLDREGST